MALAMNSWYIELPVHSPLHRDFRAEEIYLRNYLKAWEPRAMINPWGDGDLCRVHGTGPIHGDLITAVSGHSCVHSRPVQPG